MDTKDKVTSAFIATFPTPHNLRAFAENRENAGALLSLMQCAHEYGLIRSMEVEDLEAFVRLHSLAEEDFSLAESTDFGTFLKNKEEFLNVRMSGRNMTERINKLLDEYSIGLPRVSNSMLSRLKKENADTTHKQNVLRSMAFWLGHERPELGPRWNYESLFRLCWKSKPAHKDFQEGVRIGFAFYSRGDVIDNEVVAWLRKTLKQYTEKSTSHFPHGQWGKVQSQGTTTLYIDFPKEEDEGDPAAYRSCLRNAISLAHQVSIHWSLSPHCTKNRFLSIGIAAGEFTLLDNYLLPVLNARLPGDPVIRMTDYVRQCLMINDIRAFLCQKPSETTLFNGESLSIWWVVAFCSLLYFDFIPELLDDAILKNTPESTIALSQLLFYHNRKEDGPTKNKPNAVSTFFNTPHNTLLGLEIAKTLFYRKLLWESLEILRIVLSTNPEDLMARTLRLIILRNLALEAPNLATFEGMIQQAEEEALYIEAISPWHSEDFYCEYAALHQAKALHTLRWLRGDVANTNEIGEMNTECPRQAIFESLGKAEALYRRGMAVSPSAIRSSYLFNCVKVLKAILLNDEELFQKSGKPLNGNRAVVKQASRNAGCETGILRYDLTPDRRYDLMTHLLYTKEKIHDDSVALETYRSSTLFAHAVTLWDFLPAHTVATTKRTLGWLKSAAATGKRAADKGLYIYSFTRTYGEIMPAEEFVHHVTKGIRMVEESAGPKLYERKDEEGIPINGDVSSLLMTLNF